MQPSILRLAWIAPASLVLAVAPLSAQTLNLLPMSTFGYDDGSGEIAWKANNPSLAGDWFSVDFGSDASGALMVGLWADSANTGLAATVQQIGYAPSASNGSPDLSAATLQAAAVPFPDSFNSETGYATPCMDPGSDFHVVYHQVAGDTTTWIVTDTDGSFSGRSFYSTNSFTSSVAVPGNLRMGYAGYGHLVEGTLLINGSSAASLPASSDVCLTFTACQSGVGSSLYLCAPVFYGPLLPAALSVTGGPLGGPCDQQWTLCSYVPCSAPINLTLDFCCVYLDPCDLRPFSGKPKAKVTAPASLFVRHNPICDLFCWGQRDDGIVDANIWKVQNPAGTGDWFNVLHENPGAGSGIRSLTGVQMSSWDYCGNGPCWAEVGVYADLMGTPDIHGTVARSTSTNPCMPPASADSGPYPMTQYDIPDIPFSSASAWHVAAKWPAGDTCIWLGSDTDGVDSLCGITIPSAGTTSGFAADAYASGVTGFTAANWCMKIDWN